MAAVHPYQRVLLANRDILLSELPTDRVLDFLEERNALSVKEIDDIKIGRSQRERIESLLDVLHYKGERVFNEFCRALDEYSPKLAARMSDKDPQADQRDKYYNERNSSSRYSSTYSDHDRGYREINGDDFHRDFDRDRDERDSKPSDMRGEPEPHYAQVNKRPRDMDRVADDNRSVGSHHSRHSERGGRGDDYYRKTPRRADELNPAEHYILEKQTIHLEKANANQGFGIAVSGGLDNPHYKTGDTSIVVSDIVTGSPAHGLLRDNDIIVQVNDVNVEHCYHRDAVQALKDAGTSARLIIKRRKIMPPGAIPSESKMDRSYHAATLPERRSKSGPPTSIIHLKKPEKEGFGFSMAFRLYIKDVKRKGAAHYGGLQRDHVIQKINGRKTEELSLKEAIDMVRNSQDLELVVAEKKLDRYSSTKSLPSVGKKGYENGFDGPKDEEPLDRRRAKSLDRQYIRDQRRARRPSDSDKGKEDGDKPLHDGLSIEAPTVELEKPIEHNFENDIKPVEVKQELRNAPEELFKALESDKPPEAPVVVKQEVKVEESVPDIPPRRYSDPEPPKLDEADKGMEPSWKRLAPSRDDDRDSDRGRESERHRDDDRDRYRGDDRDRYRDGGRDQEENQPYVPQPADVTRTAGHVDLTMNSWDQGLSPGRGRSDDHSRGSTPQSQRKEKPADFIHDRDTKSILFRKEGSLGIQIQGGNKVGIFVNAVRENNPAYKQGLRRGDQILMANDIDFKDITREEAVLLLLSLGDEVSLYARPKMSTYERIKNSPGDSFYIKCHFDYIKMKPEELDMNCEDVFHVWDTMHNGMIGSWHAQRVTLSNDETETGIIPNKCRAEQLATVRQVEEDKTPKKAQRTHSLKRIKDAGLKKHKSTDRLDTESFSNVSREFKLPAYERVSLRSPGFVRPVVLLGPIADITRDKLLQDMPDVFAVPTAFGGTLPDGIKNPLNTSRRTINYGSIKAVVDSGKHCVVDIAPDEVERLNYCQFYPIVIFLKAPNKTALKDLRTQHGSTAKNVKKMYDNSVKIENVYSNMFSATIPANGDWYTRVKEEIRRQQDRRVWMSEDKFEDEDMEFRLHPSRYSTGHEYDPHNDSPTNRSSVSHPPDEEIHVQSTKELESTPTQMYNGPEVEYRPYEDDRNRPRYDEGRGRYDDERDRDRGRYDDERDRDRGRYDDERDRDRSRYDDDRDRGRYDDRDRDRGRYDDDRGRYGDEIPYDSDVDRASKPGYKPVGNVVKVLPSSQEPGELRQSLRKTRPTSQDFADHPPDLRDGDDMTGREGLRKSDYEPRYDGPNPSELELKYTAESLRKVEAKPDLLDQYDERVGVKVSELFAIDKELQRDRGPPKGDRQIQPVEVAPVQSKPDDLDIKLRELENSIPKSKPLEPAPKPRFESKTRNVIIDNRSGGRPTSEVRTTFYPRNTFATVTHVSSKSEPEVRAQVVDRIESAPVENGYRSLPHSYGRRTEPVYRTEYTLPSSRKPERPKSAYGYSSQAYAPKPYGTEQRSASPPPRPAQPTNYDYRLSKQIREPEPRPGTYRSDYRPKDYDSYRDESQVITSDFESLDDDTQVVATARGTFTSEGGVLSSPETGVSIHIPQGAIEPNKEQEIYFKVCKDNNIMPPLDADKGETLLSPLVMCGPHGTQFLKPVELRLPHCASMTPDGWSFALKSSDTPSGMPTSWKNVSLPGQENKDKCQVDPNSVSVLVDHF